MLSCLLNNRAKAAGFPSPPFETNLPCTTIKRLQDVKHWQTPSLPFETDQPTVPQSSVCKMSKHWQTLRLCQPSWPRSIAVPAQKMSLCSRAAPFSDKFSRRRCLPSWPFSSASAPQTLPLRPPHPRHHYPHCTPRQWTRSAKDVSQQRAWSVP
jgi:hypothetical protein